MPQGHRVEQRTQEAGDRRASSGTAIEQALQAIWSELLRVQAIGIDDSFYDLGGDSLEAFRLATGASEAFGLALTARLVLERPTIRKLAVVIEQMLIDDVRGAADAPSASPLSGRAVRRLLSPAGQRAAATLSTAQLGLLEDRLRGTGNQGLSIAAGARVPGVYVPVSYAQERAWRREVLTPGDAAHHLAAAVRIDGPLNVPALGEALTQLARSQELLRARFITTPSGELLQTFVEPSDVPFRFVDLSTLALPAADELVRRLARAEARRPFDLGAAAWRVRLVRLAADRHVLLVTLHEIVGDAWSVDVLGHDLMWLYRDVEGGQPQLTGPRLQYADWALWQRSWLESEEGVLQLAYWRDQLADLPPPELGRSSGAIESSAAELEFDVGPAIVHGLRRLSREEDATLYMALVGAVQSLLYFESGETDLAIGCPTSGRANPEFDSVIGPFMNPLVLRTNVTGNMTFRELLVRTRSTALDAYANHDVPYEPLLAEFPEREDRALFQVALSLLRLPNAPPAGDGIVVENLERPPPTTTLALEFAFYERESGLHGVITYRLALFDRPRIERLAHELQALLAAIGAHPDTRLDDMGVEVRASSEPSASVKSTT